MHSRTVNGGQLSAAAAEDEADEWLVASPTPSQPKPHTPTWALSSGSRDPSAFSPAMSSGNQLSGDQARPISSTARLNFDSSEPSRQTSNKAVSNGGRFPDGGPNSEARQGGYSHESTPQQTPRFDDSAAQSPIAMRPQGVQPIPAGLAHSATESGAGGREGLHVGGPPPHLQPTQFSHTRNPHANNPSQISEADAGRGFSNRPDSASSQVGHCPSGPEKLQEKSSPQGASSRAMLQDPADDGVASDAMAALRNARKYGQDPAALEPYGSRHVGGQPEGPPPMRSPFAMPAQPASHPAAARDAPSPAMFNQPGAAGPPRHEIPEIGQQHAREWAGSTSLHGEPSLAGGMQTEQPPLHGFGSLVAPTSRGSQMQRGGGPAGTHLREAVPQSGVQQHGGGPPESSGGPLSRAMAIAQQASDFGPGSRAASMQQGAMPQAELDNGDMGSQGMHNHQGQGFYLPHQADGVELDTRNTSIDPSEAFRGYSHPSQMGTSARVGVPQSTALPQGGASQQGGPPQNAGSPDAQPTGGYSRALAIAQAADEFGPGAPPDSASFDQSQTNPQSRIPGPTFHQAPTGPHSQFAAPTLDQQPLAGRGYDADQGGGGNYPIASEPATVGDEEADREAAHSAQQPLRTQRSSSKPLDANAQWQFALRGKQAGRQSQDGGVPPKEMRPPFRPPQRSPSIGPPPEVTQRLARQGSRASSRSSADLDAPRSHDSQTRAYTRPPVSPVQIPGDYPEAGGMRNHQQQNSPLPSSAVGTSLFTIPYPHTPCAIYRCPRPRAQPAGIIFAGGVLLLFGLIFLPVRQQRELAALQTLHVYHLGAGADQGAQQQSKTMHAAFGELC